MENKRQTRKSILLLGNGFRNAVYKKEKWIDLTQLTEAMNLIVPDSISDEIDFEKSLSIKHDSVIINFLKSELEKYGSIKEMLNTYSKNNYELYDLLMQICNGTFGGFILNVNREETYINKEVIYNKVDLLQEEDLNDNEEEIMSLFVDDGRMMYDEIWTTNYDNSIEVYLKKHNLSIKVIHLHGRIEKIDENSTEEIEIKVSQNEKIFTNEIDELKWIENLDIFGMSIASDWILFDKLMNRGHRNIIELNIHLFSTYDREQYNIFKNSTIGLRNGTSINEFIIGANKKENECENYELALKEKKKHIKTWGTVASCKSDSYTTLKNIKLKNKIRVNSNRYYFKDNELFCVNAYYDRVIIFWIGDLEYFKKIVAFSWNSTDLYEKIKEENNRIDYEEKMNIKEFDKYVKKITLKTILVTGSKGFIGSHAVKQLEEKGYSVVGLDNKHNSGINDTNSKEKYYEGDFGNKDILKRIFEENKIDLVMHFAGLISVPESVEKPDWYFEVNHKGIVTLLEVMKEYNVHNIIFSSTAATYGNPKRVPILEEDEQLPINPYGESKLRAEKEIINSNVKYTIFRYFNVAGSGGDGLGYFPKQKASHLIPLINNVAADDSLTFKIFGDDYNTEDGTCIRDYVHVVDLVNAHVMAADKMLNENDYKSDIYNISSGSGYSVKEVYETANKVHNKIINVEYELRRAGDPDLLIASAEKLEKAFGWKREHNLEDMIRSDFEARFK